MSNQIGVSDLNMFHSAVIRTNTPSTYSRTLEALRDDACCTVLENLYLFGPEVEVPWTTYI